MVDKGFVNRGAKIVGGSASSGISMLQITICSSRQVIRQPFAARSFERGFAGLLHARMPFRGYGDVLASQHDNDAMIQRLAEGVVHMWHTRRRSICTVLGSDG